jgi:hypothetical protein
MKKYFNSALILDAVNAIINHTYPYQEGYARTDALGRGVNGVFGPLSQRNINRSNGAVSYPPLWYTHDFDWVQSPAAIRQPLGRNVTEAWGVNVMVELNDPAKRFGTTARIENMFWMETLLATLNAPKWPENILGPIDPARVERGRILYNEKVWDKALPADKAELEPDPKSLIGGPNPNRQTTGYCARCHGPALETKPNQYGLRYLQLPLYRMEVMGTDSYDAMGFRARQVYTGVLEPLYQKERVGVGEALTFNVTSVVKKWFKDHNVVEPCESMMEGYRESIYRALPAYPARPLDGYWATPPHLHNGSVRTMYELLSPATERAKSFWIGSREFDPVNLGFHNERIEGAWLYDTSLPGNSKAGHEFRDAPPNTPGVIGPLLTHDERLDIIEYLKVMDSVSKVREPHPERNTLLDAMAPYYEKYSRPRLFGAPETDGGWKMADFCASIEKVLGN